MIFYALWLMIISLLLSLATSIQASPVGSLSPRFNSKLTKLLGRDNSELLVGIRYVSQDKAREYHNNGNQLTAIPATTTSIGEGVYLFPRGGLYTPRSSTRAVYVCLVYASKAQFLAAPMLFVDDARAIIEDEEKLKQYVSKAGFKVGKTILFSRYFATNDLQMVIPPAFLAYSPSHPNQEHGSNTLGIRTECIPESQYKSLEGSAAKEWNATVDWQKWKIPHWPARPET